MIRRSVHRPHPCGVLVWVVGMVLTGCGGPAPDQDASENARARSMAIPVRVAPAGSGTVEEALSTQGRLDVWRREVISAEVPGIIREFPAFPDQRIAAGALVMRLDAPYGEDDDLAKAVAKRDRAKRTLDRFEYLAIHAPATVATTDLETARDAFADAGLDIDRFHADQAKRRILAPFSGVLIGLTGVIGDSIKAGDKIGELLEISHYRLSLQLPETSLRRLALGQPVEVTALIDDSHTTGTVASIPAAIDEDKGLGEVVIDTPHPPATWRPGGFATARLVLKQTNGTVVLPRDKISYEENRAYCWVAEAKDGVQVARRAWLELGASDETSVVVTKGVHLGEQVIIDGVGGISDGVHIAIIPPAVPATSAVQPPAHATPAPGPAPAPATVAAP